ncbi:MAG: hypothetical protein QXO99_08280 [Candidatus Methanomethylicia archaeon]
MESEKYKVEKGVKYVWVKPYKYYKPTLGKWIEVKGYWRRLPTWTKKLERVV